MVSGSGVLVQGSPGTLVLSNAANTYTGGTTVSAGTLQIGDGVSSNGSLPGNVVNSASLAFNNPTAFAYSGNISGTGVTNIIGAGPLTLSGTISGTQRVNYASTGGVSLTNNTYTGGTTVSSGTMVAQVANLGYGTVNVASGATLSISNSNTGLLGLYYNSNSLSTTNSLPAFQGSISGQTPSLTLLTTTMNQGATGAYFPPPYNSATNFEAYYTGMINVPTTGTYTFNTSSDDGSNLWIDGSLVVNNNNSQPVTTRSGSANLTAGEHQIVIGYWQGGGGYGLDAQMSGVGNTSMVDIGPSMTASNGVTIAPDAPRLPARNRQCRIGNGRPRPRDRQHEPDVRRRHLRRRRHREDRQRNSNIHQHQYLHRRHLDRRRHPEHQCRCASGATSGNLIFAGGTLQASASFSLDPGRTVVLGSGVSGIIDTNGNALSIPGTVTGGGGLTKTGAGTLTLSGANVNFTGAPRSMPARWCCKIRLRFPERVVLECPPTTSRLAVARCEFSSTMGANCSSTEARSAAAER